jgi:hypothetical protein
MKTASLKSAAVFVASLSFATSTLAQYVWLDEKGVKQFSDMPPPISVPQNRILKQPGASAVSIDKNTTPSEAPAEAPKGKAPMTTAEKNADFQKRKNEQAEKDKKAADEAKRKANQAQNCERAQEYAGSLSSGLRVSRTDKNGERIYLSDEQREKELQEARAVLADCNK